MNPSHIYGAVVLLLTCHLAEADQLLPSSHFLGLPACVPVQPVMMPHHIYALPEAPNGEVRIAMSFSPTGKIVERVFVNSSPLGVYDEASVSALEWLTVKSEVGTSRFRHCQMEVVFNYRPFEK